MPGIAVLLIAGVFLYEIVKPKAGAVRTQSAANAKAPITNTTASTITQALANIAKQLQGQQQQQKPTGGGASSGAGAGSPSAGPRASQSGFSGQSNQEANYNGQPVSQYGSDENGNAVWIDADGNVFDQQGNLLTDLSGVTAFETVGNSGIPGTIASVNNDGSLDIQPPPFSQTAPGDGSISQLDLLAQSSSDTPQLDNGSTAGQQDAFLGQDANESFVTTDDWSGL